jgi:diacylglycerol O-acyltransferase / wax synthase
MVPLAANQAVCFGIMSYNGGINFGLTADYDSSPDLEALAGYLEASIAELVDATASPESRGVRTAGARERRQQTEAEQQV